MTQQGIAQSRVEERGKVEIGEVTFSFWEYFLEECFLYRCWVFAHPPLTGGVNLQSDLIVHIGLNHPSFLCSQPA